MKKILTVLTILTALAVVPAAMAEEVKCYNTQYGGSVCGIDTTTQTTVTHDVTEYKAGIADWTLAQIIAFAGVSALTATILYKKTYRLYIFG